MFNIGNTISVVNFQEKSKWVSGVLEEQIGPLTFWVQLEDGHLWKKQMDHIHINIPAKPVMTGLEKSSQPLRSQRQNFRDHTASCTLQR